MFTCNLMLAMQCQCHVWHQLNVFYWAEIKKKLCESNGCLHAVLSNECLHAMLTINVLSVTLTECNVFVDTASLWRRDKLMTLTDWKQKLHTDIILKRMSCDCVNWLMSKGTFTIGCITLFSLTIWSIATIFKLFSLATYINYTYL
jgi:hypothetical protein